jgi:hypothetical protein
MSFVFPDAVDAADERQRIELLVAWADRHPAEFMVWVTKIDEGHASRCVCRACMAGLTDA